MSYLVWKSSAVRYGFSIVTKSLTIGRNNQNSIELHHDRVSRRHAQITATADGYFLIDHSTNGTFVNGVRVSTKVLCDGDEISFAGSVTAVYKLSLSPDEINQIFDQKNQTFVGELAA